jgi:hypothetical protein
MVMGLQEDGSNLLVRAGVGWKPGVVREVMVSAKKGSSEGNAVQRDQPVCSNNIDLETRSSPLGKGAKTPLPEVSGQQQLTNSRSCEGSSSPASRSDEVAACPLEGCHRDACFRGWGH